MNRNLLICVNNSIFRNIAIHIFCDISIKDDNGPKYMYLVKIIEKFIKNKNFAKIRETTKLSDFFIQNFQDSSTFAFCMFNLTFQNSTQKGTYVIVNSNNNIKVVLI